MQKKKLLLILIFFFSACAGHTQQNPLSENQFALQSEAIVDSISNTPYSALIRITSLNKIDMPYTEKFDDYSEQKIICYADVIETYRGEIQKNISYVMYVEKGEEPNFPETAFIITLCKSNEGFYWPGVGAIFSADIRLRTLAKEISKQAENKQMIFEDCE